MFQPFSCLLWIAALLCIILYASDPGAQGASSNLYLAIVLVAIILLTGYITFQQTSKSEALMDSFKNFLPQQCVVIREGQKR
jgi:sodium/potassium-transporting ATPase subunit alpha